MKTAESLPIATFNEPEPARALCQELAQAGFETCVNDKTKVEKFWFFSKPLAAVHVQVHAQDFARAAQLLAEWGDNCKPMKEAIRCPECGSSRIEFPQITRKFLMPMAARLFMAFGIIPREFYCQNCQYTWPLKEKLRRTSDETQWPLNSSEPARKSS